MCRFKSALLLKDHVFVPDYDSHDDMLEELKIPDDYMHASKVFVRVELSPADGDPASDPMGWEMTVDQDFTPDWFDRAADEQRVKEAIAEWCKVHVLREGEHEVHEGRWIATGNSTVTARGNSKVTARGNSKVTARGNSKVTARGNSTVEARGNSKVTARGNSKVTARGNSTVEAWDNSTVTAWDNSTVTAWGNSTVTARGNSKVTAWDNSTVTAWDNSTVTAWDNSTVTARGNSTVILPVCWQTTNPVKMQDKAICINHKTHTIKSAIKWTQED